MISRTYSTDFRYNLSVAYDSFYSLPFAAPPLGKILASSRWIEKIQNILRVWFMMILLGKDRFGRPKPPSSWTEPRNATKDGAPVPYDRDCYQVHWRCCCCWWRSPSWRTGWRWWRGLPLPCCPCAPERRWRYRVHHGHDKSGDKMKIMMVRNKDLHQEIPESGEEPFPVMVWLTGGAFLVGGGSWSS